MNINKLNIKQFIKKWMIIELLVFGFVIALDLISKTAVANNMNIRDSIVFIKGFMSFTYVQNTGGAFSVLAGKMWFFILVTSIAIPVMIFLTIFFRKFGRFFTINMSVIIAGALGNMIDRLAFGYVRDFFEFTFMNFGIFNVADIALTVGVIVLAIYMIFFCEALKSKPKEKVKTEDISEIQEIDGETNDNA